jgi:hypothetical protein
MQTRVYEMTPFADNVLTDGGMDEKLIELLVERELQPEKFYLTGFETISFNRDKMFAIETVLSSTVAFDNEVLVVNTGEESRTIMGICETHELLHQEIQLDDLINLQDSLESVFKASRKISKLVFCEEDGCVVTTEIIKNFRHIATRYKVDVIVVCNRKPFSLKRLLDCGISFMISNDLVSASRSLIVALRSKLVQSEGLSRSLFFDLHRYWQRTLKSRKHLIEPMAV